MKKSYYCLFGTALAPERLAALLGERLDIEFERRESSYVGEYLKYSGLYADKLTIEANQPRAGEDFKEERFKQYPVLIYLSNTSGKNADKLSKTRYLKARLLEIDGVTLLKESVLEEP